MGVEKELNKKNLYFIWKGERGKENKYILTKFSSLSIAQDSRAAVHWDCNSSISYPWIKHISSCVANLCSKNCNFNTDYSIQLTVYSSLSYYSMVEKLLQFLSSRWFSWTEKFNKDWTQNKFSSIWSDYSHKIGGFNSQVR